MTGEKSNPQNSLELIWGSRAIGDEIGLTQRQAYYGLEQGLIPAKKFGRKWCSSRAILREYIENAVRDSIVKIEGAT